MVKVADGLSCWMLSLTFVPPGKDPSGAHKLISSSPESDLERILKIMRALRLLLRDQRTRPFKYMFFLSMYPFKTLSLELLARRVLVGSRQERVHHEIEPGLSRPEDEISLNRRSSLVAFVVCRFVHHQVSPVHA